MTLVAERFSGPVRDIRSLNPEQRWGPAFAQRTLIPDWEHGGLKPFLNRKSIERVRSLA